MSNGTKIKIGLALLDIAGIGGLLYFISNGWVDAIVFVILLFMMIAGCALIVSEINESSVDIEKPDTTPIYSVPLRKMGFVYDDGKGKWYLGGDGASFLVRLTVRHGKSIGVIECFNFVKKQGGTFSGYVTSMEDIRHAMILCGIADDVVSEV